MSKSKLIQCDQCKGTGEDHHKLSFINKWVVCDKCQGSGTIVSDDHEIIFFPQDDDSYYRRHRHDADFDEDI